MKQSKTSGRLVKAAIRRAFVLDLRKTGMTYRKIVEQVVAEFPPEDLPKEYDSRQAWKDVMRELRRLNEERTESATEVRRLELERLDALTLGLWERAVGGDDKEADEKAVDRILKIMHRRAAFQGLDATKAVHNLNLDLSQLTDEQLERISSGENPASVLAASTPSSSDAGTETAKTTKA